MHFNSELWDKWYYLWIYITFSIKSLKERAKNLIWIYDFVYRYGRVYDISSGRVPQSAGVKTMMDYLVFTNAEVINYFIDKKGIERVIVTDDLSAQRLFHR